jgi:homoserine O-acetyltransferase
MTTTARALAQASAPVPPRAAIETVEGMAMMPGSFELKHGGRLQRVKVGWRLTGPADAPVVAVLGGISAHRIVTGDDDDERGWWPALVGPGRGVDTSRWRILSFDWLGGSGGTTGPAPGSFASEPFPSVSPDDQARLLAQLLDYLQLGQLHAFIGASYGGMVALAFGALHPSRLGRLLVLCAAERAHPLAIAWRSIQRRIVRMGLKGGTGHEALAIARGLAITTYRSADEFSQRFGGPATRSGHGHRFPVEAYLEHHGEQFASRIVPESYLCLSESIDLQDVDPASVCMPTTLVAIRQDQLVPISQMRSLASRIGRQCRLYELDSLYGHDGFLKEGQQLAPLLSRILEGTDR